MCFNAPNMYQLGWYSAYYVNLPVSGNFAWTGDLVGMAEKGAASASDKMIVRIVAGTTDVYINFNRQIGINSGTQEGGNQVLVTTRSTGTGYAPSKLQAKLSAGGTITMTNFAGTSNSMKITVNSINVGTVPARANVSTKLGSSTSVPTPAPVLPTPAPVLPTPAPVLTTPAPVLPTPAPVLTTSAPVLPMPTPAPVASTSAPVSPTPMPAPVVATPTPTQPPTPQPTPRPTRAPFSKPTRKPTKKPTRRPTRRFQWNRGDI